MRGLAALPPGARGLAGGGRATRAAFGLCGLAGSAGAGGAAAAPGRTLRLPRERLTGGRAPRLALQDTRYRARDPRPPPRLSLALTHFVGVAGALAGPFRRLALLGRPKRHSRPARLGETDRDRLLRRACPVLAATDLVDFLLHELASLGARRFAFAPILACLLDRLFARHIGLHSPTSTALTEKPRGRSREPAEADAEPTQWPWIRRSCSLVSVREHAAHVPRLAVAHGGGGIAPTVPDVGDDRRGLPVIQEPTEGWHGGRRRRIVGGDAPGPVEHDAQERARVRRLHGGRARERREQSRLALAIGGMTRRALIRVDLAPEFHRGIGFRDGGRWLLIVAGLILEVDGDRVQVGARQPAARALDLLAHGTGRSAESIVPGSQVGDDVVGAPVLEAMATGVGDVGREPTLDRTALQEFTGLVPARDVLRCVAGPAMHEALDQIGPAVPFGALLGHRVKRPGPIEELVPRDHPVTDVERKRQRVSANAILNRLRGREIGADRDQIVARHARVIGIGHRGIKMRAVAADAARHRADELVIGPGADAGLAIGSDVAGNDVAEGRLDGPAAGEVAAVLRIGVAAVPIGRDREIAAPLDESEILLIDGGTCDARARRDRQDRQDDVPPVTHRRAGPDFSDIGSGSRPRTSRRAPPRFRSDCSRRSAGRRWHPARRDWVRPNSGEICSPRHPWAWCSLSRRRRGARSGTA